MLTELAALRFRQRYDSVVRGGNAASLALRFDLVLAKPLAKRRDVAEQGLLSRGQLALGAVALRLESYVSI